jgi:hypothetical protein
MLIETKIKPNIYMHKPLFTKNHISYCLLSHSTIPGASGRENRLE